MRPFRRESARGYVGRNRPLDKHTFTDDDGLALLGSLRPCTPEHELVVRELTGLHEPEGAIQLQCRQVVGGDGESRLVVRRARKRGLLLLPHCHQGLDGSPTQALGLGVSVNDQTADPVAVIVWIHRPHDMSDRGVPLVQHRT